MNPERWKEVERIFVEALGVEPREREAFVRRACGEDEELLREVLRLVRAGSPESEFLVPPTPEPAGELPADVAERRLGDFELLAEIGRGGMGVVFRAWQRSLGRHVALKLLPAGPALSRRQIDRFRREARAVAKLHHPGIVQVLVVGEEKGTHYFAMELVDGHDLGVELLHLRHEAAPSSKTQTQLPSSQANDYFRAIARIVRDAADALHYAHEHGIVHRDVKPTNLLLDSTGRVKLVDFGLACDEEQGSLTKTGEFAGTPHYVSPEQAKALRHQIDHRTDVYSLGVVLYELLTLQRPFDGHTSREILSRIVETEAPRIRKRNARVPRDLATVCETAMAKEPRHRYGSAAELRDDLERFLGHQAIRARAPSPLQRTVRWAGRHKAALLAAACLLFATLGGLAIERTRARSARIADHLAAIAEIRAAGDLDELPATRVLELRQHLRALEREGWPAGREPAREAMAALEDLRRRLRERGTDELARARDRTLGASARERHRLSGLQTLFHAAYLFPEDDELRRLASIDAAYPHLAVHARDESGNEIPARVLLRPIDVFTSGVGPPQELGATPLARTPLLPGYYRAVVVFDAGGFREIPVQLGLDRMEAELVATRRDREEELYRGMVRLEGGPYTFGDFPGGHAFAGKAVEIAPFYADRVEVSNRDYYRFIQETGQQPPALWRNVENFDLFLREHGDLPVVGVPWNRAVAYATWNGKRLPTAGEWHLMAGGREHRPFPYAVDSPDEPPRGNVHGDVLELRDPHENWRLYLRSVRPVRSMEEARSPEGLYHLWGNVAEWTESIPIVLDPDGGFLPRPLDRLEFGKAWTAARDLGPHVFAFEYYGDGPGFAPHHLGFRCVRSERP